MKITAITVQQKDPNRVNVMVDGKYRFSLDIVQVGDLNVRVGNDYTEAQLEELLKESEFGKVYARALEYCLIRPHSGREVRDYLRRKMLSRKVRNRRTGELTEQPGISLEVTERVYERLLMRGYINDEKFALYWIENRNITKGTSLRKLRAELRAKGVDGLIIDTLLQETERNDVKELKKVIEKKQKRYPDQQKLMLYLSRQGFSYDDIRQALSE